MATSSHSFKGGIADEIKKIAATPGFEVEDVGLKWKVTNTITGVSSPVHKGIKENSMKAALKNLEEYVGWTQELFEAADEAERSARMAQARRVEYRTNAFIASLEAPLEGGAQTEDTHPSENVTRGKGNATVIDVTTDPIDIPLDIPEQLGSCSLRFEWITAEAAEEYLSTIVSEDSLGRLGQRPVSTADVAEWSRRIRANKFRLVPDPILFDEDGALFNGQHRLRGFLAAVKAGYSYDLPMLVGYNWPRDLFMYVDHGKKRTTAQTLAILKFKNAGQLAATVVQVHKLFNVPQPQWGKAKFIDTEVIDLIKQYEGIEESHRRAYQAQKLKMSRTAFSAAHYFITVRTRNPRAVDKFFDQLGNGTGLNQGDPVYALREFFLRGDDRRVSQAIKKMPQTTLHLYYIIKAWNNTQRGAWIERPGFRSPGTIPEVRPYVPPRERAKNAPPEE